MSERTVHISFDSQEFYKIHLCLLNMLPLIFLFLLAYAGNV